MSHPPSRVVTGLAGTRVRAPGRYERDDRRLDERRIMTDTQSNIRINSSTLFAALRVLEEALPLVDEAVFEDDLMDDEDRRDWVQDLESVQRMLKAVRPSHTPRSW